MAEIINENIEKNKAYFDRFCNKNEKLLASLKIQKADLYVVKIGSDKYAATNKKDNNIDFYFSSSWDLSLNLLSLRKRKFTTLALNKVMKYEEICLKWECNIYDINEEASLKNVSTSSLKNQPTKKPIDKFSMEYFEIWEDANFYGDRMIIMGVKTDKDKSETANFPYMHFIGLGHFTIDDALELYKTWCIDETKKNMLISKLTKIPKDWPSILEKQITDHRMFMAWINISKERIRQYRKMWLIGDIEYKRCMRLVNRMLENLSDKESIKYKIMHQINKLKNEI